MDGRTLMFGVGATKAGTSWLHRYLCDHPQCDLPQIKELHYFDRIGAPHLDKELTRLASVKASLLAESFMAKGPKAARLDARIEEVEAWIEVMQRGAIEHDAYLAFLGRNADVGTRLVGDITPAYGLMDESVLAEMAAMAPDTRFVMLLRDPLDRLWSNLRMMAGWRLKDGEEIGAKSHALFDRMLRGKEDPVIERSDYTGMLKRLRNVVPVERLHVEFYETLFTQDAVDRICTFLGLASAAGPFQQRVHVSPEAELDPERAVQARDILLPHYDYALGLMGELPARWHQNREVLT
ncbi:MAG: sulfotransferase [Pseudomonadota bacterium]